MTTQRLIAAVAVGLLLGVPGLAKAQFTTVDVPDATRTAVNGNSTHQVVGEYDDADGNTHGFVLNGDTFTTIDVPGAWYTTVNGVNANGEMVGIYRDDLANPAHRHGFVLRKGASRPSTRPTRTARRPSSSTRKARSSGLTGRRAKTTRPPTASYGPRACSPRLKLPDAVLTSAIGLNDTGDVVGVTIDDVDFNEHGFVLADRVYMTLDADRCGRRNREPGDQQSGPDRRLLHRCRRQ